MAGNAVIGALRVVIGADTAQLEKGLKGAQSKVSSFADKFKTAAIVAAGAMVTAGAGIGLAVKGAIDQADKLGKMAQSIGVPVEELSKLKHAADLSGVGLEGLSKGVGRLNRNITEAAQGLSTPIRAFKALGIEFKNTDGTLKTVSELLPQLADKFSKMRDGPEKTALAMQLLGRAGADMIPLLNAGKSGLTAMMLEAEKLGITIDTKTAKAAEAFNDNLTRLGRVKDGIITKLTAEMLPALARFSEFMIEAAKNSNLVNIVAGALAKAFDGLARAAIVVYDNIGLVVQIGAIFIAAKIGAVAIAAGIAFVKFAAAVRTLTLAKVLLNAASLITVARITALGGLMLWATGNLESFTKGLKALGDKIAGILPEGVSETIKEGLKWLGLDLRGLEMDLKSWSPGDAPAQTLKTIKINAEGATKAIDKFTASIAKRRAGLEAELQTLGLSVFEHERLKIVMEAEALAKSNNINMTGKLRAAIDQAATSFATISQKVHDAKERFSEMATVGRSVHQSLEDGFVDAITSAKSFGDAIKGIIKDFAKLAAQQAFRALFGSSDSWGTSFGNLFGGGKGSTGLFGKLFGFAGGGSFMVGGSGGIDSQLVAFKASPNERVSVTKPGQMMSGGTTYAPIYNIDARGSQRGVSEEIKAALVAYDRTLPEKVHNKIQSVQRNSRRHSGAWA